MVNRVLFPSGLQAQRVSKIMRLAENNFPRRGQIGSGKKFLGYDS